MKKVTIWMVVCLIFILGLSIKNLNAQNVLGDVNNDSKVNLDDAIYALQVTAGLRQASDAKSLQDAINSLPSNGGIIYIRAGVYILTNGIHINKSNVSIIGERGVVIKIGNNVKQPVLLIGTDKQVPTQNDTIQNIRIFNIEIDGNKDNQTGSNAEYDPTRCIDQNTPTPDTCWIRNNGIDVRAVNNLWIENVDIHDARSGGIVASWRSQKIFISNSSFYRNSFDGIALYDSQDILISNFLSYENGHAGLSLDNKLKHVSFNGGSIKNNGDVGIFARDSEDIGFHNLMIFNSGSHGCFISHQVPGNNTGVKRLFFSGCSFLNNAGRGFVFGSNPTDSPNNTIIGCFFSGNTGCIEDPNASLNQVSNICK